MNVFGPGSLFQLLCTARTAIGQRGLMQYLNRRPGWSNPRRGRTQTAIREQVSLLGRSDFAESSWETFAAWLRSPRLVFPQLLQLVIFVTMGLLAGLAIVGLAGALPWAKVAAVVVPLVAFHIVVGMRFHWEVLLSDIRYYRKPLVSRMMSGSIAILCH